MKNLLKSMWPLRPRWVCRSAPRPRPRHPPARQPAARPSARTEATTPAPARRAPAQGTRASRTGMAAPQQHPHQPRWRRPRWRRPRWRLPRHPRPRPPPRRQQPHLRPPPLPPRKRPPPPHRAEALAKSGPTRRPRSITARPIATTARPRVARTCQRPTPRPRATSPITERPVPERGLARDSALRAQTVQKHPGHPGHPGCFWRCHASIIWSIQTASRSERSCSCAATMPAAHSP